MPNSIKVFFDTEFTDFINCDIISIGLITEDGKAYYAENAEYIKSSCSTWVNANIIPTLNLEKFGRRRNTLSVEIAEWIDSLDAKVVYLYYDYSSDIELLGQLLENCPPNCKIQPILIQNEIYSYCDGQAGLSVAGDEKYFKLRDSAIRKFKESVAAYFAHHFDKKQHNALDDAEANKYAYFATIDFLRSFKC